MQTQKLSIYVVNDGSTFTKFIHSEKCLQNWAFTSSRPANNSYFHPSFNFKT
jgi:hypothetical protein